MKKTKQVFILEPWKTIKISDVPGLRKFYDDLNTNIQVLENMGPDVAMHLSDPRRMKLLSTKLPRN